MRITTFDRLDYDLPLMVFDGLMYAAYIGRAITAVIEIYFCWGYLSHVLKRDDDERRTRKRE